MICFLFIPVHWLVFAAAPMPGSSSSGIKVTAPTAKIGRKTLIPTIL
jgi:hypothetical protein